MTNEEYSDLRYKIVARENRYFLTGIVVSMFFAFITIGFLKDLIKNPFSFGWLMIAFWFVSIALTWINNPWKEKKEELNRLFKLESSYEEAEKKLELNYEPPKNWNAFKTKSWVSRLFYNWKNIYFSYSKLSYKSPLS
jgi:predicted membrane protein